VKTSLGFVYSQGFGNNAPYERRHTAKSRIPWEFSFCGLAFASPIVLLSGCVGLARNTRGSRAFQTKTPARWC